MSQCLMCKKYVDNGYTEYPIKSSWEHFYSCPKNPKAIQNLPEPKQIVFCGDCGHYRGYDCECSVTDSLKVTEEGNWASERRECGMRVCLSPIIANRNNHCPYYNEAKNPLLLLLRTLLHW